MENLNKNAKTKELREDLTKDILPRLAKKYMSAIGKVEKVEGEYEITFAEGYTIFNQKTRRARNIPGIMWYSRIASEEKAEGGFNFEKWAKYFKENKVVWDGKNIPDYIETEDQVRARTTKTEKKAEKKAEDRQPKQKETK